MAEYWKSTPKYWCKQCQIYIRDTAFEKTQHEATGKHQGNLKRFLRDIHRNKEREQRDTARTQNEVERLRNLVSGKPAPPRSARTDATQGRASAFPNTPRQATAEDRKKQVSQLVEMGVAVPEEYRRDMAIAGDWQTVSVTRIDKGEEEDGGGPRLNTGVRKRKHEENEDEDYEAQAAAETNVRKGWGSATRSYPGASGDTDDLDALLSKTKTVKRNEDADTKPEPDTEDVVKGFSEVREAPLTKAEPDPAGLVKEDPDSLESPGAPLLKSEAEEAVPAIVFKKRKNKATKK